MRTNQAFLLKLAASLLCLGALSLYAQTEDGKTRPEGKPDRPPGGGRPPGGRMIPPLIKALDANGDMEISAEEIANASKALLTLDKNGDGKLTGDEIHPPRPDGGGRPPGGRDGERSSRRGQGDNPDKRPPLEGDGKN